MTCRDECSQSVTQSQDRQQRRHGESRKLWERWGDNAC